MIGQVKVAFWWFVFTGIIYSTIPFDKSYSNEIYHTITIKHPGEKKPVTTTLTEVRDEFGLAISYYMDVESVICLAEVCKVIPVRLYWNNIGEYQRYKLKEGETLEKYEADLFEPNDYVKLDAILQNKESPFKDVFIEDIWTVPTTISDDIDAISGATILQLDEKDTVPGAALTCYTLWHWANGNVVSLIKNKTGESASNEQLKAFILNKNKTYFKIALKTLASENKFDESFVVEVVNRALEDKSLLKETFFYLQKAPSEIYLKATSKLFFEGKKEQKLSAIRSLNTSDIQISKSYLDGLSLQAIELESFQEVSALLELMQGKNANSSVVNENTIPLLKSDFLIARRAYWFLSNQELDLKQQKELKAFYKAHKERL